VRFVLDHNLSPHLARGLGHLVLPYGDEVTCLKDLNLQAAADEDWIPLLAADRWVVITCDLDIVRNPHRQLIFRKAKLTAFFLLEAWSKDNVVRGPEIAPTAAEALAGNYSFGAGEPPRDLLCGTLQGGHTSLQPTGQTAHLTRSGKRLG
jgi:hypothetical protein